MAFEDRSSPNTATRPTSGNDNTRSSVNSPNSPESSRTSPYTCLTYSQENSRHSFLSPSSSPNNSYSFPKLEQEKNFIRITSFALPSPKNEKYSIGGNTSPNHFRNTPSPSESISSRTSSPPNQEPTIQTLKYSIRNILQPEFGKSAVLKTKVVPKISFKPYEIEPVQEKLFTPSQQPPLGSLCQTVSQIGSVVKKCKRPLSRTSSLSNDEDVKKDEESNVPQMWPAWVYCTRYSDRPSSGPRSRRMKKPSKPTTEDKRPRTAFSSAQLQRLKHEFNENRYLTERRRQQLSAELGLNEAQIKIWFQNKRAKIKKSSGEKNPLALQLMAQGLYNHSTVSGDDEELAMQNDMI